MSVLQTIDLKKYYGTEPNITRALITKPAIVMITHNNEIAQLADRIVRIEDGKIIG